MGEDKYIREEKQKIVEKTEKDREKELLLSILKTKQELTQNIKNFEFAEGDLVDYYTYQMKATQSKLDYLLKKAKQRGMVLELRNTVQEKTYQPYLYLTKINHNNELRKS